MSLRITLACPRHPRYSPESGPGAIKAGCRECWRLWLLHRHLERAMRAGRLHEAHRAAREATTEPSPALTHALNVLLPRKRELRRRGA